jgi:hypothetical protein
MAVTFGTPAILGCAKDDRNVSFTFYGNGIYDELLKRPPQGGFFYENVLKNQHTN